MEIFKLDETNTNISNTIISSTSSPSQPLFDDFASLASSTGFNYANPLPPYPGTEASTTLITPSQQVNGQQQHSPPAIATSPPIHTLNHNQHQQTARANNVTIIYESNNKQQPESSSINNSNHKNHKRNKINLDIQTTTSTSSSSSSSQHGYTQADSNSTTPSKSFVPCKVCGDKASGYHYGVTSCEGCKGFFRRSIQKQIEYRCLRDGKCLVIRLNRNRCQYCRFKKCLAVGMSRDSVRYGRVPKRSRERNEDSRITQSDQSSDQSRDIENKQLAMYDIILTISQAHHAHCAYTEEKTRGIIRKPAIFSLNDSSSNNHQVDSLEQQKIVMWQHFAVLITPSIQRIVEFAKRIPGFLDLSQDDQLILIKLGFFEIWIIHISRMINSIDNTLTFADGSYITRQQMELMFDHEFVSSIFNLMISFNNLQLNDTEIGLFASIVLLQSERQGIYDTKSIDHNQEKLLEALKLQINRNHNSNEVHLFTQLINKLAELKSIGIKHCHHLQWFRSNWTRLKLPPLFAEIFDIPKCEEVIHS